MKTKKIMMSIVVLATGAAISSANLEIPTETLVLTDWSSSRGDRDYDGQYTDSYPGSANTYTEVGTYLEFQSDGYILYDSRKAYEFDLSVLPVHPSEIVSAKLTLDCVGGSRAGGQPFISIDLWGTSGLGVEEDYSGGQYLKRAGGPWMDHNEYDVDLDVTDFVMGSTDVVGFGLRATNIDLSTNYQVSYAGAILTIEYQVPCAVDFTGDGELNFLDVSAFLNAYSEGSTPADLNGDGQLNFIDVSRFIAQYQQGCP